jgi:hypothetical protein
MAFVVIALPPAIVELPPTFPRPHELRDSMSSAMSFIVSKSRRADCRSMRLAAVVAALLCGQSVARAGDFVEPPVFASVHGVLDLLMVAMPQPVPNLSFLPPSAPAINPVGWVYQICPRALAVPVNQCPAGSPTCPITAASGLPCRKAIN